MSWVGTVTDGGKLMLENAAANGGSIEINSVKIGTGIVPQDDMRTSVSLVNQVGTGTIVWKKIEDGAVQIRIVIAPQSTTRLIKEVGILGTYNGNEYLMVLYQNETGVEVPSISSTPDFAYILNAVFAIENDEAMTITVDASAVVTNDTMNSLIAPEYDPEEQHGPGSLRMHGGDLYERTGNSTVSGSWNPAGWTQRDMQSIVGKIKTTTGSMTGSGTLTVPFQGAFIMLITSANNDSTNTGLYIGYAKKSGSGTESHIRAIAESKRVSAISISYDTISYTIGEGTKDYCLMQII